MVGLKLLEAPQGPLGGGSRYFGYVCVCSEALSDKTGEAEEDEKKWEKKEKKKEKEEEEKEGGKDWEEEGGEEKRKERSH